MSTVVHQGLQSRFEHIEPCILKHKLVLNPLTHNEGENKNTGVDLGGWNFLQFLTNTPQITEEVYVHPFVKQSTTLSKQSLDMCTESLGSETGNHICNEVISQSIIPSKPRDFAKKILCSRSFPPPLSSSERVQVSPHRENGRLVIKAVAKESPENYFQTERENGRLKLSLPIEKLCTEGEEREGVSGNFKWVVAVAGNIGKLGGETEKKKHYRCKEERKGKNGISSWGPFLVATS